MYSNTVMDMSDLLYQDILKKLNLTTLETHRIRGDLLEVFKIVDKINFGTFFEHSVTVTVSN